MSGEGQRAVDITLIPGIMRRRGWRNGARLMEIWFSRPANAVPERGVPETATIWMDRWALTFRRASTVYQEIVSSRVWCNETARNDLGSMLRRQGRLTSQRTTFGDLSRPVPTLDRDFISQHSVGGLTDPLDDMYAALGRFLFRTVVQGSVVPTPTPVPSMTVRARPRSTYFRHTVNIEQVGIYVWDSYDYNGLQPLGYWSASDVSRIPLPGYELVTNGDYRQWRARHGRGGDFIVYSDVKILRRNPPDTFLVPGPPAGI